MPARGGQAQGQDHKEQVFFIRPKNDAATKPKTETGAARAVAQGKASVEKKEFRPGNQHTAGPGARAKKLDEDSESTKVKTVSHEVKVNIMKGRQAKGWAQKDLAQAINEKTSVVTDYESGKAVPNEQVLQRMEKALGIYLRGVNAGQALPAKTFKKKAA